MGTLWESIMGPRTGVDAVGGGHEPFFEVPNFFSITCFGPLVLERPFWSARFGPPVLDRTPVLDRLFRTAHLLVQFSPGSSVPRGTSVPHGTRHILGTGLSTLLLNQSKPN